MRGKVLNTLGFWVLLAAVVWLFVAALSETLGMISYAPEDALISSVVATLLIFGSLGAPVLAGLLEAWRLPAPSSINTDARFKAYRDARRAFKQSTEDPYFVSLEDAVSVAVVGSVHTQPIVDEELMKIWRKYGRRALLGVVVGSLCWIVLSNV